MIIPLMDIYNTNDEILMMGYFLGFNAINNPWMGMCSWYTYRMGPPVELAFSCLISVAEKTMVYGRYNQLVNGGYNGI